jgi:hypothetical protein
MTYRLRVTGDDRSGKSIWQNYCKAQVNGGDGGDGPYTAGFDNLHKFNAVDVKNEPFLDFATEEDAMIFKLKFS